MLAFVFECLMAIATSVVCAAGPTIKTNSGPVVGTQMTSYNGRPVSAFQGIPYAKPPVGPLRFKAPEPVEPWSEPLAADVTYVCFQFLPVRSNYIIRGAEDCLYLYVYVPKENITGNENFDVVVGIHGGAFMLGDPHMLCGPRYLMDKDLIYITMNYRLGILGFLSTEDSAAPGNYGLKDQVLALQWIKDNVKHFGGNPNSITIAGLSAGGASVHYHYLSPMSKGLFHRGFSQSGTALNMWALTKNAAQKAQKLASYHNCSDESSQVMVDCLRQIKPTELLVTLKHFFVILNCVPYAPFGPVVEKTENPFLPNHPYKLLLDGKINDVPWISSNTINEGIYPVGFFVMYKILDELDRKWDELSPYAMDYNDTVEELNKTTVGRKMREFYLQKEPITVDNINPLIDLFTDRMFLVDSEKAIRLHAKVSKSPVYYYLIDYKLIMMGLFPNTVSGVAHSDDARLLYPIVGNPNTLSGTDEDMKNIFLDFLSNFASGSDPRFDGVVWKALQTPLPSNEIDYMHVSGPGNTRMKSIKELAPTEFFNTLPIQENQKLFKNQSLCALFC